MRILVCGGRDFNNKALLYRALDAITPRTVPDQYGNDMPRDVTIIHGAARGADSLADDWAVTNWCAVDEYRANWAKHGRAAGPIRNAQMLKEGKPDLVVAFPGGPGTDNMIRISRKAGIEVRQPTEDNILGV